MRVARQADCLAKCYQQGVEFGLEFFGHNGVQPALGLFRSGGADQTKPVAESVDMGINRNYRQAECLAEHNAGNLWSNPGEVQQFGTGPGHASVMMGEQLLCQFFEQSCLCPVKADRINQAPDFSGFQPCQCGWCWCHGGKPAERLSGCFVTGPGGKDRAEQN